MSLVKKKAPKPETRSTTFQVRVEVLDRLNSYAAFMNYQTVSELVSDILFAAINSDKAFRAYQKALPMLSKRPPTEEELRRGQELEPRALEMLEKYKAAR